MIDLTGRLLEVFKDYKTRKYVLSIAIDEDAATVAPLLNEDLVVKLARKKDRRSLDANSYFHILARKLAGKLGVSETYCKNHLIASYGQVELFEDEAIIYKTNAPEEYMMEREEVHSKLVKVGEENDKPIYFYRIYRGSHTYNTEEMSRLIEGTVQECKAQGIETATPDEIAKMEQVWGIRYEQSQQRSKRGA